MTEQDWLAERFEEHRGHLRAVAYRMLGSMTEAEDAVQEAWLRLSRAGDEGVENLGGWLTTVTSRVCLDLLRSRKSRREELTGELPDPVVELLDGPEQQAVLANSVGLALLVVLDTLDPAERLAFVLHDMFGLPFDEIAGILDRSPAATRQLASRARRRVRGAPEPDADLTRQREVVNAFLAAARNGDFDALVSVLHPDVALRADDGTGRRVRGAAQVAGQALLFSRAGAGGAPVPALVNGAAGVVGMHDGKPVVVMGFTVTNGLITEIDVFAGAERLGRLGIC
ncbi:MULTISPECIES: sigma-70 family RNA polymerase sigma factor [Amycolatopsis]|uniref:RNA polymerase sigma-70 factor, ECF subfamily n=2 Tax=Amycolatopsis TaxID=1813 RepID=A0A1I3X2A9_9PSEU|nr:sigma-70 family RNA polymerase sigma factor [Amycolatopsis sacchari]SFK13898.1 RNA polymerase sigma-70 factor, ECF subfamily [Amycolatopsis sacchari]